MSDRPAPDPGDSQYHPQHRATISREERELMKRDASANTWEGLAVLRLLAALDEAEGREKELQERQQLHGRSIGRLVCERDALRAERDNFKLSFSASLSSAPLYHELLAERDALRAERDRLLARVSELEGK